MIGTPALVSVRLDHRHTEARLERLDLARDAFQARSPSAVIVMGGGDHPNLRQIFLLLNAGMANGTFLNADFRLCWSWQSMAGIETHHVGELDIVRLGAVW